jgi:hypothetical protein
VAIIRTSPSLPDLIWQPMRLVSMDHRVRPVVTRKDALARMALSDAINLLLHRVGIGVDVNGDGRRGLLSAIPEASRSGLFPLSTPCLNLE